MIEHVFDSRMRIRFRVGAPLIEGETLPLPDFDGDTAMTGGLELTCRTGHEDGALTVNLRLRNRREAPVRLESLPLLWIDDAAGLPGGRDRDWRIFRMARQKNDIPGFFRPSLEDDSLNDALFDSSEVRAGGGISGADAGAVSSRRGFEGDPALILRAGPESPPLLIGFVGQDLHLNKVALETDASGKFIRLKASAEYDGVVLAPGGEVSTHTLVLRTGADTAGLLEWLTERIAGLYGATPKPQGGPTVFCSWYFYGRDFREEDLHENMEELRRRPVPCDVILIDNGWMDRFGDWNANNSRFPSGMRAAARRIAEGGYTPGIWTAPFVMLPDAAILRKYPDLILRSRDGEPCVFPCVEGDCRILDPFAPHAPVYLRELFERLKEMGYLYHKLDFVRAVLLRPDARFGDGSGNRAQAYRYGIALIRDILGPDCFVEVCGGLFEGSAGLADAVRSGSDVRGHWDDPARLSGYLVRIKQNVFRNHYRRLWYTDADALQLRRRTEPFRGNTKALHLSMGVFSDEEAFAIVVNQFLGGGLTGFAERLKDMDEDRRRLLRHAIPQYAPPARALDMETVTDCPETFLTEFAQPANGLDPWRILTLANWSDKPVRRVFRPAAIPPGGGCSRAVFEFREQKFLGIAGPDTELSVTVPAHGVRVVRLTDCREDRVILVGADCNLSQGMEIGEWRNVGARSAEGRLRGDWRLPVTLTYLTPGKSSPRTVTIAPDRLDFRLD